MVRSLAVVTMCAGFLASTPVQAEVRFQRAIQDKSVTFVLDEWDKLADGSFKNSRTDERKTEDRFWDYANGLAMDTAFACGQAYGYYEMVEAELVERHAKIMKLREAAFRDVLNKPVAGNPNVTYRELFAFPPAVARADFVPRQVRVGSRYDFSGDDPSLFVPSRVEDLPREFIRQVIAHEIMHRLNLNLHLLL